MYLAIGQGDGILNNLVNSFILICILFSSCVAIGEELDKGLICAEQAMSNGSLVKTDQEHKRIFVVMKNINQAGLNSLVNKLESCFKNQEWDNKWSLSVFSTKKLAGY